MLKKKDKKQNKTKQKQKTPSEYFGIFCNQSSDFFFKIFMEIYGNFSLQKKKSPSNNHNSY